MVNGLALPAFPNDPLPFVGQRPHGGVVLGTFGSLLEVVELFEGWFTGFLYALEGGPFEQERRGLSQSQAESIPMVSVTERAVYGASMSLVFRLWLNLPISLARSR